MPLPSASHLTQWLVPALVLPLLLLSSACATRRGLDPRVKLASETLPETVRDHLRDRTLAASLNQASLASDRGDLRLQAYNKAVKRFILELQTRTPVTDWSEPIRIVQPGRDWLVSFDKLPASQEGRPHWSPSSFTRILPTDKLQSPNCTTTVTGAGAGTPLVLANEDIDQLVKERAFRPRVGIYVPATAILEFGRAPTPDAPVPVRLRFINTYDHRSTILAGRTTDLAFDITAAVNLSLDNKYVRRSALEGLLRPDQKGDDVGLFGLQPYDPKRIPVVFVHGLKSDTHIWNNAVAALLADPQLARRYQPILFLYPTGLSIPASAERLRSNLRQYRDFWDPEHDDPGMNNMIVVGHSMGGLLTRHQVSNPGTKLSRSFFEQPLDRVPWLTDDQLQRVRESLEFTPQPFVTRVVFIATPHRGSRIADLGIVRLAVRLIQLPGDALTLASNALLEDNSFLNPALLQYNMIGLRSVDMLSPGHPYLAALSQLPVLAPYHNIIGSRGKGTPPDVSDGIVPYTSAHLDGAASELVVPYPHSCTEQPETVAEVLRILRLHATR